MIKKSHVDYRDGDAALEGYLAHDDAQTGKRPGVLVFHDWKSIGDGTRTRTDMLAELGYVALAADIYGKGVRPASPDQCGAEMGKYTGDRALLRSRCAAALAELRRHPLVDSKKVAAVGYCFGGMCVLELARSGADVPGVVSFHGVLGTPNPADAKNIKGKVLVLHGADDPIVPPEQVAAFEKEMRDAKVDWQLTAYGGAVHSFTNPASPQGGSPSAYHPAADRRSWQAMKDFFGEIFA